QIIGFGLDLPCLLYFAKIPLFHRKTILKTIRLHHNGKIYYFCSDSCCRQFIGKSGEKE
ncbi:MAG: hypothetical protein D3905_15390, partial [Candidatus Electrothrix sp. AS4_5]|nr:hypothetical protein [Candidatus Electrothrix gigas]